MHLCIAVFVWGVCMQQCGCKEKGISIWECQRGWIYLQGYFQGDKGKEDMESELIIRLYMYKMGKN